MTADPATILHPAVRVEPGNLPVACVRYWSDPCQDQHFKPAPEYRAVLRADIGTVRAAIEAAIEYCDYSHVRDQLQAALRAIAAGETTDAG